MARGKKSAKTDPSYRKLKADYYPVQRQIQLATSSGGTTHVADVGRLLSMVNHRLYRQGKTYQVKIDLDNRSDVAIGPAQVEVYALVDTWYIQKAWQMARATYLTATAAERANMSTSALARWEDFRVTAGLSGGITVQPYRFANTNLAGAAATTGEFSTSQITLADGTTERTFTWSGSPSASEFGILTEYDKSGNTNQHAQDAANTGVGDQAYAGAEDGVFEKQMDDLQNNGNYPPYNRETFTNYVWVKIATLDNSGTGNPAGGTGQSRMSTGFFNAPCGLIAIKPSISHQLAGEVSLTVKAGNYKGVAAMNMGA